MSRRWVVGLDIGGTSVVVGVIPAEGGAPGAVRSLLTEAGRGPDQAVDRITRLVDEMLREVLDRHGGSRQDVLGVGIGCPGPIDLEGGRVQHAFNLGWGGFPLRDRLSAALDLPASLDNDANCAAYGEWWQGAGRGLSSLVCVTVGTGIGGGFVLDGKVLHGASGTAGEIGHTTINFAGRRCKCGNYGCLEAYASGPNIAARAQEGLEAGAESILNDMVDGDLDRITAVTVYDALVRGDAYAREVMVETAKILGAGVANVINTLNPDMVVIVGGVTKARDHLFGPLRAEVRRRAFRTAEAACRIVPGELPETAGAVGAAGLFLATERRGG
jgi:glucokinase